MRSVNSIKPGKRKVSLAFLNRQLLLPKVGAGRQHA